MNGTVKIIAIGLACVIVAGALVVYLATQDDKQKTWDGEDKLLPFEDDAGFMRYVNDNNLDNLSDDQKRAAYNLMNNDNMSRSQAFACLDRIIDPDDPEGSLALAEKVLFIDSSLSTFNKAHNLLNSYAKEVLSRVFMGDSQNFDVAMMLAGGGWVSPEELNRNNADTSKDTFTFSNGRTVSTDKATMDAYTDLTRAVRGTAFVEAIAKYGVEQARQMYDVYFHPPVRDDWDGIL